MPAIRGPGEAVGDQSVRDIEVPVAAVWGGCEEIPGGEGGEWGVLAVRDFYGGHMFSILIGR